MLNQAGCPSCAGRRGGRQLRAAAIDHPSAITISPQPSSSQQPSVPAISFSEPATAVMVHLFSGRVTFVPQLQLTAAAGLGLLSQPLRRTLSSALLSSLLQPPTARRPPTAMSSSRAASRDQIKQSGAVAVAISARSDAAGSDQPQPAAAAASSPAATCSRPRRSAAQQAQIKLMQQVREKTAASDEWVLRLRARGHAADCRSAGRSAE